MTASATADSTSPESTSADSVPANSASHGQPVGSVPSPSTPVPAPPASSAPPGEVEQPGQPTPAGVLTGRGRIDDLDARILALIAERVGTAADIQSARIAEGGRRLDLKRETEIITRYREALGRPGVTIAMAVLELCRGRV